MHALKNAVSRAARGSFHLAAVFALGCSAGTGDSNPDGESQTSVVAQDLRIGAHRAPPKRPPHPVPPPRHPGHGHGGTTCNPPPGAAGTAGSSTGTGGFESGAGGASAAGAPGDDSGGGGAPEGGFTSSGGASTGGVIVFPDPCGDGIRIYNACDDGNTVSGDGCSDTCELEPGYACDTPGAPCRQQRCGDGFQDVVFTPGDPTATAGTGDVLGSAGTFGAGGAGGAGGGYRFEGCDDGNTVDGDGCSATCDVETGFICPTPGAACRQPRCGDGFQDFIFTGAATGGAPNGAGGALSETGGAGGAGGSFGFYESCDDGNTTDGDGCSATCSVEDGYLCMEPNTPCRKPRCGDGFVDYFYPGSEASSGGAPSENGGAPSGGVAVGAGGAGGAGGVEQCDDGNTVSGDGCSATCQVE